MKTLFAAGFRSDDIFAVRHPSFAHAPSLGRALPVGLAPTLGDVLSSDAKMKLQATIQAGTTKMAAVRAWIASRIDQDPMLRQTLTKGDSSQNFVVDNFWGYDDLVVKDQYYVDQAQAQLSQPDPDLSEDTLGRVDEWAKAIDIMYAAMLEYGGAAVKALPVKTGPAAITTTVVNPKTGMPVPSTIAPGASVATPPPSSGISTNTLLIGGGIAAAALAIILAMKS